jgi:type III secretory pathway component EscU
MRNEIKFYVLLASVCVCVCQAVTVFYVVQQVFDYRFQIWLRRSPLRSDSDYIFHISDLKSLFLI